MTPPVTVHKCAATSCTRRIGTSYLMCFDHWKLLPKHLQTEIYAQYHSGLRKGDHPNDAYVTAVQQAIHCVEEAELHAR